MKLLQMRGNEIRGGQMLDTYNQQIQSEVSCTIRTNINTANHHFIVMEVKIIKEGNYSPSGHNASNIVSAQGIAPAVMENHGTVTAISEPISVAMRGRNPNNPSERGKSNGNYKQRLEMNESGVANTITSVQKNSMVAEPMCSVHPNSHKFEFDPETSIKPISPALRATDYKAPHCVYEPRVEQVGNIYPDTDTFKNRTMGRVYSNEGLSPTINCCGGGDREPKIVEDWQTIVGNKQLNPFRGSVEGTSPCITSACGAGGGMTPMLTDADLETTKTKEFIEQVRGHEEIRYRIRKLTPRECFRLMGVDDADIDKIQLYPFGHDIKYPSYSYEERLAGMSDEEKRILMRKGISNSQQYKLAGNSIVVDVLYHIFRKMFCETENENDQLTLF